MAETGFARRLVIMVKEPAAGRVKTRLARSIGSVRAVAFYRHVGAAVLHRLSRPHRWQTYLAVTPDTAVVSRCWPVHVVRVPQGPGDLARRMQRLMDRSWKGPVAIVGSDIPAIRPVHIAEAFRQLGGHDAVFGPAPDGGYWLVGLRRIPRILRPFGAVRWSGPYALADTRANLAGRRIAETACLFDVDTIEDYRRAAAWYGRRILPIR
ncbi:MAG: TIGR04282 family arsenosugar biosynthesis glycosyltransferase [Hyphomicrobiaceae bacterium]